MDITITESFVCPIVDRAILRGYEEYVDLPDNSVIRVYSLDEIVVEKVRALTDPARNEPRDLYDIWFLTTEGHVDLALLVPEIKGKMESRGHSWNGLSEEFDKKETRLKKLWDA